MPTPPSKFVSFLTSKWTIALLIIVAGGGGYIYIQSNRLPAYQLIPVTRGSITETVSVTGNTTPMQSVTLGFQNSGTIAHVYYKLGDRVNEGDVVAELNTATLSAALQQAEAAYKAAVASRSSTSLPEAQTQARNVYASTYTSLDNLLHNSVDTFFGSPTGYGPMLLINAPMFNFGELSIGRASLTQEMQTYKDSLETIDATDPAVLLTKASSVTQDISDFLDKLSVATNDQGSSANSTQRSAIASARTTVNSLLTTLSTARDSYRSLSVGATSLASASVEQAAAGVAVAKANLQGTKIVAPISGTLTQVDAKVGQLATMSTPLISIISNSGFEVDAGVSETDIGKLAVGNPVSMTLDAFPSETFTGKVFYIAPAQTNTNGVITYQIKISFSGPDSRFKSGLTANVDVETKKHDDVLILPQYAILLNDSGTFVETPFGKSSTTTPITLGIQDQKGNVEVLSGVTLGEEVINIGLKQTK